MSIPEHHCANFDTLREAFACGDVCLLECADKRTGALVFTICMVNRLPDEGNAIGLVPVARMFDEADNPLDDLAPSDSLGD